MPTNSESGKETPKHVSWGFQTTTPLNTSDGGRTHGEWDVEEQRVESVRSPLPLDPSKLAELSSPLTPQIPSGFGTPRTTSPRPLPEAQYFPDVQPPATPATPLEGIGTAPPPPPASPGRKRPPRPPSVPSTPATLSMSPLMGTEGPPPQSDQQPSTGDNTPLHSPVNNVEYSDPGSSSSHEAPRQAPRPVSLLEQLLPNPHEEDEDFSSSPPAHEEADEGTADGEHGQEFHSPRANSPAVPVPGIPAPSRALRRSTPRECLAEEALTLFESIMHGKTIPSPPGMEARRLQVPLPRRALHRGQGADGSDAVLVLDEDEAMLGKWVGWIDLGKEAGGQRPYVLEIRAQDPESHYCPQTRFTGTHATGGTAYRVTIYKEKGKVTIEDKGAVLNGLLDPVRRTLHGRLGATDGTDDVAGRFWVEHCAMDSESSTTPSVIATTRHAAEAASAMESWTKYKDQCHAEGRQTHVGRKSGRPPPLTSLEKTESASSSMGKPPVPSNPTPRSRSNPRQRSPCAAVRYSSPCRSTNSEVYASFRSTTKRFDFAVEAKKVVHEHDRRKYEKPSGFGHSSHGKQSPSASFKSRTKRFPPPRPRPDPTYHFVDPRSIGYSTLPARERVVVAFPQSGA